MRLILLTIAVLVFMGTPAFAQTCPPTEPLPPPTATEFDLNLLNTDGSNIDPTLLLTIDYLDNDLCPQSINSVDNTDSIIWEIFGGMSNMYASVPVKDGTDITITIDGYESLNLPAQPGAYVTGTYYLAQLGGGRTDEFDVVMEAAIANNGAVPPLGQMKPIDLKAALDSATLSDDPLIIDLRTYPEYSIGHIPGAINIYYRYLGKNSTLSYLEEKLAAHIDATGNNQIVTYGNTHHLKGVANYLASTQGYPVKNLKLGFARWTSDETAAPGRFKECTSFDSDGKGISPAGCTSNNFATTTLDPINASHQSGEGYPTVDCIDGPATSADLAEIARCMYDWRFGDLSKPDYRMTSRELYDLLNDGDPSNDPYILSNRGTDSATPCGTGAYYDKGHISDAVAVDWCDTVKSNRQELKVLNNTDFMPTDRLIVHHCWVGQSQQYGNTWYPLLGYNSVTLDYGMNGWSDDGTVRETVINPTVWYNRDYPFDTTPGLANPATDKPNYAVGETVIVTWDAEPAPTQPNNVMVEIYNVDTSTTENLAALPPSTTSYAYTAGASATVYIYYADDASDKHGDPGTSDEISTSYTVTSPEFPFGLAILFGLFVPIYFSMRKKFLESTV